jgi:hypothetical protein
VRACLCAVWLRYHIILSPLIMAKSCNSSEAACTCDLILAPNCASNAVVRIAGTTARRASRMCTATSTCTAAWARAASAAG